MAFPSFVDYDRATWSSRWRLLRRVVPFLVATLAICAAPLRAEELEQSGRAGFRRVFVPAERPDLWPTGGEQFLPVDAERLQELLKRANASDGNAEIAATHAADAVFYARYIANRLIEGRACIAVEAPSGQPSLIEWPPARATIRDPQWRDRENELVKLGTWGGDDGRVQRAGLVAERSGSLLFKFETPATVQSERWSEFSIISPHALRRRLYIDLPGDHELISDVGRVELVESPVPEAAEDGGAFLKLDQLGLGYQRWLLSLGPGDTVRVRVKLPSPSPRVRTNAPSYREVLNYSLTPRGIDFTGEFHFFADRDIPESLTIELDPELHLVGVEWGRLPLEWQEQPRGPAEPTRVQLAIPQEARDRRSPLRISAWRRNPGDELRRLPQVTIPDLFWSEGTLRIELAEELELLDLESSELLPQSPALSSSPMHRAWEFVKLRSQAMPEIAVRKTTSGVEASIGTSLELSSASTKAVTRLQLRPRGRSVPPRLEAEVLGSWEIDAVETSDASNFTDWYVDQIDDRRILRVQLREPFDAAYPIEVAIEAHAPRSAAVEGLTLAELMPIDWRPLDPSRHVLAVTVIESLDLQIDGQVRRLSFDDLVEQDWELLQDAENDVMVLMNEADLSAKLRLLPQRPTLEADVQIVADVQRGVVHQRATIRLAPLRIPASKIRVQLTPAPTAEIKWIDPETSAQLPAVRVSDAGQTAELGEEWEVQLGSGTGGSQSLQANWASEIDGAVPVPLVALPDAAKQRATIAVEGDRVEELQLVPIGLIQHPLVSSDGQSGQRPMATYRYDPAQFLRDPTACTLAIQPQAAGVAIARAVVKRADLESKYPPQNDSIHRAEFLLEGVASLRCKLPDGARLQRVTWDGQALNVEDEMGALRIDPPANANASSHTLQIDFALPQPPLRDGMSIAAPLPDLGLPLSVGKWTLFLPESFQLATPVFIRSIEPGWRGRLAGNWAEDSPGDRPHSARGMSVPLGWQAWGLDFAGTLPAPVELLELRKRQALAYGVGLLVACLTAWQFVGRPPLLGVLLCVAALASIWLPPTSSMFATASWLGMILGVGWTVVARQVTRRRMAKRENATTMSLPYATASLLVAATLAISQTVSAQSVPVEPEANATQQAEGIIDVLIPVDEQGVPAGSRHYVPARFWEELLRATRREGGNRGGDWVIRRGRYQGELRRDTTGGEVHSSVWTLSWEVDTLRRNARVWLPLDRRDGKWETDASVDGIPVAIVWDANGTGCEVAIREPGPHRIALRMEPATRLDGQDAELELRLPAVLDAELKLIYPSEMRGLELPDAAIPTPLDSRRSKAVVALPIGDRLSLSWPSQGQSEPTASPWQVDQLELLSIESTGAELNLRLSLQGSGAPPAEVALAFDEMLEPLDLTAAAEGAQERRIVAIPVAVEEGTGNSDSVTASASFRLRRDRVLGNYRFPQVEVVDLVTRSKVAAVSLSDRLSYETMQSPAGESMEGSAFASLWNDGQSTYAAAHRIQGDQSPWTFSVQPRVASSSPEESLVLVCAPAEIEVDFQSQMEASGSPVVKQTLQIPPELRVEDLKVVRSIGREPVRWTRPTPDRLVAFFAEPLDEYFRLSLVGTIPQRPGQDFSIPEVTSRPGENLPQRVQIHRRPECLVRITGPAAGTLDTEGRNPGLRGSEAYAVAEFTDRLDDLSQVTLRTSENRSRYSSQSLTWFDPEVGVTFVGQLEVDRGVLDHAILEVPAEWIGPLEITPSAQVGELGETTPGRRRVKIQFAQPVPAGERVALRFTGSVAATRDGSWLAPILLLADSRRSANFLAIPSESSATRRWSLEGVVEMEGPPALVRASDLPEGARVFRIRPARRRDFAVRRLPDSQESAMASLALADVYVREDASGSRVQTTQFLLPPIGQRELILEWPSGSAPIGVYLENRLLTPMPLDADRWRLPIGPSDLPFVLTAVSRTGNGASTSKGEFRRPKLRSGETEYEFPLTLWTVESPRSAAISSVTSAASASDAENSTLKLAHLSQLLSVAEPRMGELSDEDRTAWKQLWLARLGEKSARLEEAAVPTTASSGQVNGDAEALQARQDVISQVAQLLGRMAESESGEVVSQTVPAESPRLDGTFQAGRSDRRLDYYSVSGPESNLELTPLPQVTKGAFSRVALTVILVTALGVLLRWAHDFDFTRAFAEHPRWLVALLGILWWVFLTPAAIGIALLAIAALTWAADRWQRGGPPFVARV